MAGGEQAIGGREEEGVARDEEEEDDREEGDSDDDSLDGGDDGGDDGGEAERLVRQRMDNLANAQVVQRARSGGRPWTVIRMSSSS